MKKIRHHFLSVMTIMILCCQFGITQIDEEVKYTISGHIKDGNSGEELINATLFIPELSIGNVTNVYGFYSLTVPSGKYTLQIKYLGYEEENIVVDLTTSLRKDIDLYESQHALTEITITAKQEDKHTASVEMSNINIAVENIKKLPALFGEVDIIKAIQLLPGVKSLGEGTSGYYVRGGNADQNLVLLDEAPIYNSSHLLGFFSSFNPDAIKDMQLSKGAISAAYGGRLSSVLDIRMKEGNSKKFGSSFGIGTIMTRLAVEAPISDRGSFILSGRRSYLDVMAKTYLALKKGEDENEFNFYFYDLNAKGNYRINDNNRLFISGYFGRDVIKDSNEGLDVAWGNKTSTIRWNHIFSPKLFSNLTGYTSSYDYGLTFEDGLTNIIWKAKLEEISGKADFTYYATPQHTIKFGAQVIKHDITPGDISISEKDSLLTSFNIDQSKSFENAIYVTDEWKVNEELSIAVGLRASSLHNVGPNKHINVDESYQALDTVSYEKGIYNSYYNLEPRIGIKYALSPTQSIKSSYNRTVQYIQQASNGNAATPFDIWFTSSPVVKPQIADQYSIGYFRNFNDNKYEFSVEMYYKNFSNAIDFKERAQLLVNKQLESELRIGSAKAYGLEFLLKKDVGKLTGWIGYTYSKIEKKIDQINDDQPYNAKYDKPHDFSLVAAYELSNKLSISGNFVYSSGSAVTFPTGKYTFNGTTIPVYSERNGARLPNYHRADFSLTLQSKKNANRILQGEWVFSIYNVYNRKNAFAINFKQDEVNPTQTYAEKSAVFSIVPSLSYNAKF